MATGHVCADSVESVRDGSFPTRSGSSVNGKLRASACGRAKSVAHLRRTARVAARSVLPLVAAHDAGDGGTKRFGCAPRSPPTLLVDPSAVGLRASQCTNVAYSLQGRDFAAALDRAAVANGDYVVVLMLPVGAAPPSDDLASDDGDHGRGDFADGGDGGDGGGGGGAWAIGRRVAVDLGRRVAVLRAVRYEMCGVGETLRGPPRVVGALIPVPLASCLWHLGPRFPRSRSELAAAAVGLFFEYARNIDRATPFETRSECGRVRVARAFWRRVPARMRTLGALDSASATGCTPCVPSFSLC